ncbi:MAG: hypothetical protein KF819_22875 [Labilithrix sp.]|nr:hypothetical protein [Labilithrix sp.]
MASEAGARPWTPRRLLFRFLILAAGLAIFFYFSQKSPREQHVRIVLGPGAPEVTAVELQYVADDEIMREARMTYEAGRAPRVVAHDPQLPDGEYRLKIDVDTREGRRAVERRVTLGGGTTQVDLALPAVPSAPLPDGAPSSAPSTAPSWNPP